MPDEVGFTRVGHVLTVGHLRLVAIVTVTNCPQRYRRYKTQPGNDDYRKLVINQLSSIKVAIMKETVRSPPISQTYDNDGDGDGDGNANGNDAAAAAAAAAAGDDEDDDDLCFVRKLILS